MEDLGKAFINLAEQFGADVKRKNNSIKNEKVYTACINGKLMGYSYMSDKFGRVTEESVVVELEKGGIIAATSESHLKKLVLGNSNPFAMKIKN